MSNLRTATWALALSVLCICSGSAQTTNINVKTGLWESTVVTHTTGLPPIPDDQLQQMTPEQRQQFQAAMEAARARGAQPRTVKSCITKEKLERGLRFDSPRPNCKRTILNNTSTVMEVREDCTGEQGMTTTMTAHYEAKDPETVAGTFQLVVTRGGSMMTSDGTIDGKWVADDCGDVK